ncbi:MAG: potassium channel family protein [Sporolactobacillus sp.]
MGKKEKKSVFFYHVIIVVLALLSISLVVFSLFRDLSIVDYPYNYLNNGLLLFFTADYAIRLFVAKDKKRFLIENSFDLLGLIPMHPLFVLFRFARIVRILRHHHIFVILGVDGKLTGSIHKFIYSTGFIYLFSISVVILVLSALLYSIVEKISLSNALWWAVTTATTVGYGDIYPQTVVGKIIASFLMFGGIGFIGLLTSTITDFFTFNKDHEKSTAEPDINKLSSQIEKLSQEIEKLSYQVNHLSKRTNPPNRKNK